MLELFENGFIAALLNILVVFDLTWKGRFFNAKKDFLKQRCAQGGVL